MLDELTFQWKPLLIINLMLKVPQCLYIFWYFNVCHFLSFLSYYCSFLISSDFESNFICPFRMLISSPSQFSSSKVRSYLVLVFTPSILWALFDTPSFCLDLISSAFLQRLYNLRDWICSCLQVEILTLFAQILTSWLSHYTRQAEL